MMRTSHDLPIWIGKRYDQGNHFSEHYLVSDPSPCGLQQLFPKDRPSLVLTTRSLISTIADAGRLPNLVVYDECWFDVLFERTEMTWRPLFTDPEILQILSDKVRLRSQKLPVPMIAGKVAERNGLTYNKCREIFPKASSFVVHGGSGSACANVRIIRRSIDDHYIQELSGPQVVVTPLREKAVPYNIHLVIGRQDFIVAPPSLQLLAQDERGQLSYGGCDFSAACFLSPQNRARIREFGAACAEWLQKLGYVGIAGVDFLLENNEVALVEVNPRYQASTGLLNANLFRFFKQTCQSLHVAGRAGEFLPKLMAVECRGAMTVTAIKARSGFSSARPDAGWDQTLRQFHSKGVAMPPFDVFPRPGPTIVERIINEAVA